MSDSTAHEYYRPANDLRSSSHSSSGPGCRFSPFCPKAEILTVSSGPAWSGANSSPDALHGHSAQIIAHRTRMAGASHIRKTMVSIFTVRALSL